MGLVSDIRAKFTASADGFNKTVDGVKSKTSEIAGGAEKTESRVAKSFSGMARSVGRFALAYAAIKGTTAGLSGLAKSTIGANMEMEQYEVTLSTVLKSQEKATEYLEWANKFAASTPFEIPQIVDATAKLETYGINAKDTLGSIGDMAAIMGKPLDQAVEAVADAQTGELERLKEFGITKQMLIDKGAEMYDTEIVNAKGQITDMDKLNGALFAIMDERYSGGMDKMSKTAKGMISNVKDSMGTIAREMSKPMFEKFKNGLKNVLPVLSSLTSFIRGDTKGAMDELVKAFGQDKADKIMGVFKGIQTGAQKVKQFFKDMKPTIDNVMQIFVNLSPIAKALGTALASAFLGVMKVLPPILEKITAVAEAITGWEGFLPLVTGLAAGFVALKTGLTVAAGISKLVTVINLLRNPMARALLMTNMWKKAQMLLNATLLANPIVAIIALIVAIGVALVMAYKKSETFRNFVNGLWDGLKVAWQAVANFFTTTIPQWFTSIKAWFANGFTALWTLIKTIFTTYITIFKTIITTFITAVKTIFTNGWNAVKTIFSTVFNWIKTAITTYIAAYKLAFQMFMTAIKAIWNAIKTGVVAIVRGFLNTVKTLFNAAMTALKATMNLIKTVITTVWKAVKNAVVNTVKALWNAIKTAFNTGKSLVTRVINTLKNAAVNGFNALKNGASNAVKALWNAIKSVFNSIRSFITSAVNRVRSIVSNGFNAAKNLASSAVRGMLSAITSVFSRIMSKVRNTINNIKSKFSGLNLKSIGKDIMNGLLNGIKNGATAVWNKAKEIADGIKDKIKGALKINSPSKVTTEYGQFTGDGLVVGMDNMRKKVQRTAADLAGRVQKGASTMLNGAMTAKASLNSLMTLQHVFDLKNVPANIDINTLVDMLSKSVNNPKLQRAIDRIEAKNRRNKKNPQGGTE